MAFKGINVNDNFAVCNILNILPNIGQFSKTEDAINLERSRNSQDFDAPDVVTSQVETIENVNFLTEGGDFNSYSNDAEAASALLF